MGRAAEPEGGPGYRVGAGGVMPTRHPLGSAGQVKSGTHVRVFRGQTLALSVTLEGKLDPAPGRRLHRRIGFAWIVSLLEAAWGETRKPEV